MGTHPIFESDFDCLTECRGNRRQAQGAIHMDHHSTDRRSLERTHLPVHLDRGIHQTQDRIQIQLVNTRLLQDIQIKHQVTPILRPDRIHRPVVQDIRRPVHQQVAIHRADQPIHRKVAHTHHNQHQVARIHSSLEGLILHQEVPILSRDTHLEVPVIHTEIFINLQVHTQQLQ